MCRRGFRPRLFGPQAAKCVVNTEAFARGGPKKPIMRGPRSAVTLIFVDHGIERTLDSLGFGLRPQDLLRFFELGLVKNQMFVPALVGSTVYVAHFMYIIPTYMYISKEHHVGRVLFPRLIKW